MIIEENKLEIAKADFPEKMTWEEAIEACNKLGEGWRLPNKDELLAMHVMLNKKNQGDFKGSWYWSSSPAGSGDAWYVNFSNGSVLGNDIYNYLHVRAVRDSTSKASASLKKEASSVSDNANQEGSNNNVRSSKQDNREPENFDGTYTGTDNISGLPLKARLTIRGSQWTATSQLGDDAPEYQTGVLNGRDLYDDSGMILIGSVSGRTARINGYPTMTK